MNGTIMVTAFGQQYKVTDDGTYYSPDAPDDLISILESCRKKATRVRLDYGKDGVSWGQVKFFSGVATNYLP